MNKNKIFITYRGELEHRLDPNAYHPDRIAAINTLRNSGVELKPLREIVKFIKTIKTENENCLPYLGLENIESSYGSYVKNEEEKDSFSSAFYFSKGEVLFPKLRPYLNKVHLAKFDGVCSTEFHVLDGIDIDNEYLTIFLRSNLVLQQTVRLMSGNTLPRLQTEDINRLLIPIHLPEKQKQIILKYQSAISTRRDNREKAKAELNFNFSLENKKISLPKFQTNSPKIEYVLSIEDALNVERYAFTYKLDNQENWQTIKEVGDVKLQTLTPSNDLNKDKSFTLLRIDDLPNKPFKPVSRSVDGSDVEGNVQHINTNDVLVARLAPTVRNKKIITAPKSKNPIIGSNEFIRFTCNEENNPVFVCYLLRTAFYTELMLSKSRGSTPSRYRLSRADFEKLPFPKVPKAIQDEIAAEYLKNIEEAQRLIKEGKEAVAKAKVEVEAMILGE